MKLLTFQSSDDEKRKSAPIPENDTQRIMILTDAGWKVVEETSDDPAEQLPAPEVPYLWTLDALSDAQLARAQQQSIKLELVGLLQLDHPKHRWDTRLDGKFGYTRTRPPMMPAVGQETLDLIQVASLYSYRGLTSKEPYVPSPYSRLAFESEITVPDTRTFRHAEITHTAGGLFTPKPKLKVRAGAGYRKELFADPDAADPVESQIGRFRAVGEVGVTLDPFPVYTRGRVAITAEGNVDYFLISPFGRTEHQARGRGRLSMPLVPTLFLTAGIDIFFVDRETAGRGASTETRRPRQRSETTRFMVAPRGVSQRRVYTVPRGGCPVPEGGRGFCPLPGRVYAWPSWRCCERCPHGS